MRGPLLLALTVAAPMSLFSLFNYSIVHYSCLCCQLAKLNKLETNNLAHTQAALKHFPRSHQVWHMPLSNFECVFVAVRQKLVWLNIYILQQVEAGPMLN